MAFSKLTFVGSGQGPYAIHALDYLSTAHLSATVDGSPATITVDNTRKEVTIVTPTVTSGAVVIVQRTTPRLATERLTQYSTLTTGQAGLSAALLDRDYRQNMMVMGEARDLITEFGSIGVLSLGIDGHWAGLGLRLESVGAGVEPTDAVVKSQLDAVTAGASNLPAVSGADNDDGLFVSGGIWAKRTPSQSRTHLGLGTAATLNVGTGANQIVQLDGSARYPAVDGRNIDLTQHALTAAMNLRARTTIWWGMRTSFFAPNNSTSTWYESSTTRIALNDAVLLSTAELDAGDTEVDNTGTGAASGLGLTTGVWRIVFCLHFHNDTAGSGTIDYGFRITDDTNGPTQQLFFLWADNGSVKREASSATDKLYLIQGQLIVNVPTGSQKKLCFRSRAFVTSSFSADRFSVLAHKLTPTPNSAFPTLV